ncbi:Periplasmic beta-glucosidase precursor [Posidoniimonas polymericola]|uniref:beta-glucosidase n=1 Tax=Posidoniimonas polymericola TaxID=2528002 RepID=A0A5C5YUM1_9BACT|nr:glycoside hydrolase family 3 N-terminal domain-containing protein [Posidoniimonas polymericola]TWT78466.1 Periplasmic beta-glucosidase precursor [Posidoniimonas polymericola]
MTCSTNRVLTLCGCVALAACVLNAADVQAQNPTPKTALKTSSGRPQSNAADPTAPAAVRFDAISGPVADVDGADQQADLKARVRQLVDAMTLEEKIGQMCQVTVYGEELPAGIAAAVSEGRVGSIFYTGPNGLDREAQRLAIDESRLGIPLIVCRDVVHGFRTVFPIPLGQAASWDAELVERAAAIAAAEASQQGVHWTFAPMVDICRDARWGRIAESLGEDPVLASELAAAMVRGFQTPNAELANPGIAACAKHFVGYGLSEGGRDYNRAMVSTSELHNTFLKPFKASTDAGLMTLMTAFSDINGVPASGHQELLRDVLRERWGFDGVVVSDYESVTEMIAHGYSANPAQAARQAVLAGVDMEMVSLSYHDTLPAQVRSGQVPVSLIDEAVARILMLKLNLKLSERAKIGSTEVALTDESRSVAQRLARESLVLLKNNDATLPLASDTIGRVAVIGPLADEQHEQLGCWMLDGQAGESVTPLQALREALGEERVSYVRALESSILPEQEGGIAAAVKAAKAADVAVLFVGEDAWLSGEARSRAEISLPGAQAELIGAVSEAGVPVVMVVVAGRPLTIGKQVEQCGSVLYAWHPGTMAGPAIADVLLGRHNPSGRLPVSMPKQVGQLPLYYNHPSTGRPSPRKVPSPLASAGVDFDEEAKYKSHYLDVDPFPLFPFGYGLSYTSFDYGQAELSTPRLSGDQTLAVRVPVTNTGDRAGVETVQLYVQDVAADLVRPVRELKAFRRVELQPGQTSVVEFALDRGDLEYYDNNAERKIEPGDFRIWVSPHSDVAEPAGVFTYAP